MVGGDGRVHRLPVRVYYEDTDLAGIVYYANYLKFIERGRSEALRTLGVDQRALAEGGGLVFAVRRVEVDYRAPARLDDLLEVETRLDALRGASLVMAQRVTCEGRVLVEAVVRIAFMTREGRPARLPDALKRALSAMLPDG